MMSSFLCFVCHSTVNADTSEDIREKYREVIGMNLCPDSHLCHICCYFINKTWMFKSICLKRSLEYPVLFSEKGTINLQRSETTVAIMCPEDICIQHLNTRYHFNNNNDNSQSEFDENNYFELQDDRNFDINDPFLKNGPFDNLSNEDLLFVNNDNIKDNIDPNLFSDELILPNLEPVRVTQNDLVNGEWTQQTPANDVNGNNTVLLELNNYKNEITIEGIIVPVPIDENSVPIIIDENNVPIAITIEGNDVPIIECTNTQNFEEVLMVNNLNYNPETNVYEPIVPNTFDENLEKDINETIGININEDVGPDLNVNIGTNVVDANIIGTNMNVTSETNNKAEEGRSTTAATDDSAKVDESQTPSKRSKDIYDRVQISVEQQKQELEKAKKDPNYLSASYRCNYCAAYFNFKDTYQTHMMRHEESNGEHYCSVCSLRFANPSVLRKHVRIHAVRYQCKQCSEAVRERQRPTHARMCLGKGDSIDCNLCGNGFRSMTHYTQHMQRFHKTKRSPKTYSCNVCGKNCNTRARVRTHMLTHINRKFECDQCTGSFSSPYTLNQHKKWKHEASEPQVHYCSSCNISYTSRKSLLAHLRNSVAHKGDNYKCTVCGRVCPTRSSLAAHTAAVHARTRHLVCDLCPHKRYSTKRSLVRHMEIHKVGKPVPLCHACGARFKTNTILKRHLKNVCEKEPRKSQSELDEELLQVQFIEKDLHESIPLPLLGSSNEG